MILRLSRELLKGKASGISLMILKATEFLLLEKKSTLSVVNLMGKPPLPVIQDSFYQQFHISIELEQLEAFVRQLASYGVVGIRPEARGNSLALSSLL